ncbi:adenosylhomocysteine nucleosidase [Granulicella aggregans]|uniref:Adenosylhomocysteine nucleosidase n=1 Tax=Granulicella aggregans TaxID=474949 RepID=A0A7W8E3K0_9BACT|nr:phosphorylase [Granulicella aggregans]MBB5057662.1 adenosylhomocysteine nucleosidase [Granulicella aggregans]
MSDCPAIIAALPRELKSLVKGWTKRELPGKIFVYTNGFAVAACAGMGEARAVLAVEAARKVQQEAGRPVTALISVGLAGACDPALRIGDIVRAGDVIDSRSGEHFSNSQSKQVLITSPSIASVKEKQRLYASYRASAVDMEAAGVARIAQGHQLDFQAIKVVSDEAGFEIEGLSRFATRDGQFREAAFAMYATMRPYLWKKLIALAGNSGKALVSLTDVLHGELEWYRKKN